MLRLLRIRPVARTYLNVLDYAFMFPGRASQYYFLYSPESQRILRDPLEKRHGLKFLFSHCELRGIQLGLKYEKEPTVTKLEELFGTKNRVTGTQLGPHRHAAAESQPGSGCMGRNA